MRHVSYCPECERYVDHHPNCPNHPGEPDEPEVIPTDDEMILEAEKLIKDGKPVNNSIVARLIGVIEDEAGRNESLERDLAAAQGQRDATNKYCDILNDSTDANLLLIDAQIAELAALHDDKALLIEALQEIGAYTGEGGAGTPWRNIVRDCGATARAAIDAAMPEEAK